MEGASLKLVRARQRGLDLAMRVVRERGAPLAAQEGIVKELLEQMGGGVSAQSELGKGSTSFSFLPAR